MTSESDTPKVTSPVINVAGYIKTGIAGFSNIEHIIPMSVIELMTEIPGCLFYLTGSRFFQDKEIDKFTDWDFFTFCPSLETVEIQEKLKQLGFSKVAKDKYNDSSIQAIYTNKHNTLGAGYSIMPGQIDIQFLKEERDAYMKNLIQHTLKKFDIKIPIYKDKASVFWDAMISIYTRDKKQS